MNKLHPLTKIIIFFVFSIIPFIMDNVFDIMFILFLVIMFIFGGILTPYIIANNIELLGLVERIVAYVFQVWSIVLAYKLISEYEVIKIKG